MTRRRWSSEKEVASPVVPRTLSPSQPLARRKRASAVERSQSGMPPVPTAVAIAAMTPSSLLSFLLPFMSASPAHVEGCERRHVGKLGIVGRERNDLNRPVEADQDRTDHGGAAKHLEQLCGD